MKNPTISVKPGTPGNTEGSHPIQIFEEKMRPRTRTHSERSHGLSALCLSSCSIGGIFNQVKHDLIFKNLDRIDPVETTRRTSSQLVDTSRSRLHRDTLWSTCCSSSPKIHRIFGDPIKLGKKTEEDDIVRPA